MSFPDQLKLGKFPYPASIKDLNKDLEKANGILIFLVKDEDLRTYAHGRITQLQFCCIAQKICELCGAKHDEDKKGKGKEKAQLVI